MYKTIEKVPISFYLLKEAEVTIGVKNSVGKVIWSISLKARKGFNQYRWDLIREKVDSPQSYFIHYYKFAPAGTHEIQISGEGIDLRGELTIVHRDSPVHY